MFNFNEMGLKYRDSVMARMTNNFIIMSYYNTLELLAMAKFDYKNLPTNIENEFIEKAIELGVLIERPANTWGFDAKKSDELNEMATKNNNDPTLPF